MQGYGLNWSALVWVQTAGSCEHNNEPLSSIKSGKFIKYLEDLVAYYGLLHVLISMHSWLTLPGEKTTDILLIHGWRDRSKSKYGKVKK
jgi:hypothetical protein